MAIRRISIAVFGMLALVGSACSALVNGEPPETSPQATTSFVFPELEFGRGSMPASVPGSFPTPDDAVIGATMMAGSRNLTEVVVTYPAKLESVAEYYASNLSVAGYVLDRSSGTTGSWLLVFSGQGLTGEIRLQAVASALTTGTIRLTHG